MVCGEYVGEQIGQDLPDPVIGDWASPPAGGSLGRDVSHYQVDLRGEALKSCRAKHAAACAPANMPL